MIKRERVREFVCSCLFSFCLFVCSAPCLTTSTGASCDGELLLCLIEKWSARDKQLAATSEQAEASLAFGSDGDNLGVTEELRGKSRSSPELSFIRLAD